MRNHNGPKEFLPTVDNPEYHLVIGSLGIPHSSATNPAAVGVPTVPTVPGSSASSTVPHKSSEEESDHEYYNDFDRLKRELQPLRRNETTV